jgi:hypothetical protein
MFTTEHPAKMEGSSVPSYASPEYDRFGHDGS